MELEWTKEPKNDTRGERGVRIFDSIWPIPKLQPEVMKKLDSFTNAGIILTEDWTTSTEYDHKTGRGY